jgi:hypothetical protein
LGRAVQAVASLLSIAAAIGVEYFIMHRMYPDAPRQVAAVQLFNNLKLWVNYFVVAAALFPWWITLRLAVRRWRALDGWSVGLVIGSVVHFALFYIVGIAWEVRIFLPFAMTLVPLTVTLAYGRSSEVQPTAKLRILRFAPDDTSERLRRDDTLERFAQDDNLRQTGFLCRELLPFPSGSAMRRPTRWVSSITPIILCGLRLAAWS